mmetsp:Transcript_99913/g.258189  ORF Transcript_99913/g.258189 Transcript_99913/m.258189 type:complete len:223 (+) Transcript_99913:766-1434(+)
MLPARGDPGAVRVHGVPRAQHCLDPVHAGPLRMGPAGRRQVLFCHRRGGLHRLLPGCAAHGGAGIGAPRELCAQLHRPRVPDLGHGHGPQRHGRLPRAAGAGHRCTAGDHDALHEARRAAGRRPRRGLSRHPSDWRRFQDHRAADLHQHVPPCEGGWGARPPAAGLANALPVARGPPAGGAAPGLAALASQGACRRIGGRRHSAGAKRGLRHKPRLPAECKD